MLNVWRNCKGWLLGLFLVMVIPQVVFAQGYGMGKYGRGNYNEGEDTITPTGGSISYVDGYQTTVTVALTVNDGADTGGSGMNTASRITQRKEVNLTSGSCGDFAGATWTTFTPGGTYPNFTHTATSGKCYQYRYQVSDNNSNQATYTSVQTAKVDTQNPSTPGTPSTTSPTNSSSQTWSWSAAADAVSGVASYIWRTTGTAIVEGANDVASAVTNLAEGVYNFFVKAVDTAGNIGSESQGQVTVDQTSPTISAVSAGTLTSSGTKITWNTSEDANSKVVYGLDSNYGSTANDATLVSAHSVAISSLSACVLYHYKVSSTDAATNEKVDSDKTFTTAGCSGSATVTSHAESELITTATGGSLNLLSDSLGIDLTIPAGFSDTNAYFQIKQLDKTAVTAVTSTPTDYQVINSYLYDLKALSDISTLITTFSSSHPITVKISYGSSDVSGYDQSTLKIYRWDGSSWNLLTGCEVDTTARTVTCTTTNFSVFGLFGKASPYESPASNNSNSSTSSSSSPSCNDSTPISVPNLFQIDTNNSSAKLYLTTLRDGVSGYGISYGTTPTADTYSTVVNYSGPMWILNTSVGHLSPYTTYYFKVRAVNGCNAGGWSKTLKAVSTGSRLAVRSNYPNIISRIKTAISSIVSQPKAKTATVQTEPTVVARPTTEPLPTSTPFSPPQPVKHCFWFICW